LGLIYILSTFEAIDLSDSYSNLAFYF